MGVPFCVLSRAVDTIIKFPSEDNQNSFCWLVLSIIIIFFNATMNSKLAMRSGLQSTYPVAPHEGATS